ncbi:MAG: HEAT repeat domain-containing protein [Deltaproteobacteria bacterium]|nr:HEAT repeat domain-containing protein [Deltaproteobacteria bacterium]
MRAKSLAVPVLSLFLLGLDWPGRGRALRASWQAADAEERVHLVELAGAVRDRDAEALVLQALEDRDASVRTAAAEVVGALRLRAGLRPLTSWLDDPSVELRGSAVRALGRIGDTTCLPALVRVLGDASTEVRLAAVQAVGALGGPGATLPLLDRVNDNESTVRVATCRTLGALGDRRALLPLLGALQDPIPEVRLAASQSVGELRDPRGTRGLLGLLRDPSLEVRLAATRALGTLGDASAVPDLASVALREELLGDAPARSAMARAAVDALGRIGGEDAADVLVRVFRSSEAELDVAHRVAGALGAFGPVGRARIPALTAAPLSERLLEPTVAALGDLGGPVAARELLHILEAPALAPYLRLEALRALGRSGSPEAVVPLLTYATPGTPGARRTLPEVLAALDALEALSRSAGQLPPQAFDPLREALDAAVTLPSGPVERLLRLLGATGSPRARALLVPLLASDRPSLRTAAAEGLARTGMQGYAGPVVEALGDELPAVRFAVGEALCRDGDGAALDALLARWREPRPLDRATAARPLGLLSARLHRREGLGLLRSAVSEGGLGLGAAALDALVEPAARGDPEALAMLLDQRSSHALGPSAREALSNALALSPPEARDALVSRVTTGLAPERPVAERADAAWALGSVGVSALPALRAALDDPSYLVASNASGALARILADAPSEGAGLRDALCAAWASRRHPAARANLTLALARAGLRCDRDPERGLWEARSELVQGAALEALRRSRSPGSALALCASQHRVVAIARRCALALEQPPPEGQAPVDVLVTTPQGDVAARRPYALVLSDGRVRLGVTGPGGWIHERRAPSGAFTVLELSGLALEDP